MWTARPEERLLLWREFRESLSTLPKEEAIQKTAEFWSQAPLSNQYLAADLIRDWPDPWELIHDNFYDDMSVTLGMAYTLALTSDEFNDVIIHILEDINTGTVYHTAWFDDGKYILNYEYNEVCTIDELSKDLKVKHKYSYQDLELDKYK